MDFKLNLFIKVRKQIGKRQPVLKSDKKMLECGESTSS